MAANALDHGSNVGQVLLVRQIDNRNTALGKLDKDLLDVFVAKKIYQVTAPR